MLTVSKVTSKYQASIPKDIRKKLGINTGDYIKFVAAGDNIIIKKVSSLDKDFLKLMENNLQEWNSKEDDKQFAYLEKFIK